MGKTYKETGVDIEAGEKAVSSIKEMVKSTFSDNVLTEVGSFGACYSFPAKDYKEPVLVSSSDGVGTKLIVANKMDKHDSIGQCLVNHCVDDILTIGARPLYFLDYVGTGKLVQENFKSIVKGLTKACRENGCSLIGGETAEMPDIYEEDDYDLVGNITGIVEKDNILTDRIQKGDMLIGLRSSGLHTNGYTLARSILLNKHKVEDYVDILGCTVGEEMLKVHRSYLNVVSPLLENPGLHGISHITGGGIMGNTRRIVPEELGVEIDWEAWEWLPIFKYIQKVGNISDIEMRRVFNLGIGLILVVDPDSVDSFVEQLEKSGEETYLLGTIK
ncbi:MAG: phosphoribosylformylglycinamidine cyclo-ligase [Candidatus Marinimicrobia bacterium]|nr:phosphoribosylformylglycinamidine cyclo-ligase [Candidatus Neomarinimicrobiota bacterium]